MGWTPLDQDWGTPNIIEEATVRVRPAVTFFPTSEPQPLDQASEARRQILTEASQHIAVALAALEEAIAWFSIVDPKDQGEVVRRVEALRDTIEYRASL